MLRVRKIKGNGYLIQRSRKDGKRIDVTLRRFPWPDGQAMPEEIRILLANSKDATTGPQETTVQSEAQAASTEDVPTVQIKQTPTRKQGQPVCRRGMPGAWPLHKQRAVLHDFIELLQSASRGRVDRNVCNSLRNCISAAYRSMGDPGQSDDPEELFVIASDNRGCQTEGMHEEDCDQLQPA
jgi:hypothetical protein